ncbi:MULTISPECIES: 5'(3')-deoxyribonucleotidase [unclassified Flavobacterium]|uniref:5' nucleotidase, NT5C type n=1 Tax=unclassified Flavobacterium TaxID=196869 RepID=UPI000F0C6A0B|nr:MULTISPECIES: 5'(3')-deoxyribonucleotidase [unclassified Flavobacterium]AYN04106.1 5'(3')-deoxyribonucleotidase [Flavobacterium sp. 140616W15]MCD0475556.1 5'(3')-deoxyribonucleotidase [Flavobacterium sp. EDS]
MIKKTIAVDMDGVLADIEASLIECYNKECGTTISRESIQGLSEEEAFHGRDILRSILNSENFFRTLPVMSDAVESLRQLQENFEIFIVSAATEFPMSLHEKIGWLGEHFPFIKWENIILCGSKRIINTDYMIDDHSKNLDYCMGKPIMFTAFHNINQTHHLRVNNWKEVLETLEKTL